MDIPSKSFLTQKMQQLKNGETAFAESDELIRLLKRDISKENLNVFIDQTPAGCWIIPENKQPEVSE